MNFKEKIEKNIYIWLVSILLTGFGAGFGAYKLILEISDLTTISNEYKTQLLKSGDEIEEEKTKVETIRNDLMKERLRVKELETIVNQYKIYFSEKNIDINKLERKIQDYESTILDQSNKIALTQSELERKYGIDNLIDKLDDLITEGKIEMNKESDRFDQDGKIAKTDDFIEFELRWYKTTYELIQRIDEKAGTSFSFDFYNKTGRYDIKDGNGTLRQSPHSMLKARISYVEEIKYKVN